MEKLQRRILCFTFFIIFSHNLHSGIIQTLESQGFKVSAAGMEASEVNPGKMVYWVDLRNNQNEKKYIRCETYCEMFSYKNGQSTGQQTSWDWVNEIKAFVQSRKK